MQPNLLRTLFLVCLLSSSNLFAQEPVLEPAELTKLRQQFQMRVDQEVLPWRQKYRAELKKLEDKLIQERKLLEAAAVKTELDAVEVLTTDAPPTGARPVNPKTVEELKASLKGTVWLVYGVDDKKRENMLDTYYFQDLSKVGICGTSSINAWSATSPSEVSIDYGKGEIKLKFDIANSAGSVLYLDKKGVCVLAGRLGGKGK